MCLANTLIIDHITDNMSSVIDILDWSTFVLHEF